MSRALVLGGGGVTGIAWETGVLLGLQDEGVDSRRVELTVGTSAGAAVAAQLHSGTDLEELYGRQLDPRHHEIAAELDLDLLVRVFGELAAVPGTPDAAVLARVGAQALAAPTVPERDRRAVIEHRLPSHSWPAARLLLTAVDVDSGELAVFDAASGVDLVDAVAASCAVPGVWPPVTIGDRRFMDGGARSTTCLDLAAGHDEVLVLAPLPGLREDALQAEVGALRDAGATVVVLRADDEAADAMGPNALDPERRAPAAEHGRRQGRAAAAEVLARLP